MNRGINKLVISGLSLIILTMSACSPHPKKKKCDTCPTKWKSEIRENPETIIHLA